MKNALDIKKIQSKPNESIVQDLKTHSDDETAESVAITGYGMKGLLMEQRRIKQLQDCDKDGDTSVFMEYQTVIEKYVSDKEILNYSFDEANGNGGGFFENITSHQYFNISFPVL